MTDMCFYGDEYDAQVTVNPDGSVGFLCYMKDGKVWSPSEEDVEAQVNTLKEVLLSMKNFNRDCLPDHENSFNNRFDNNPMTGERAMALSEFDFSFSGGTSENIEAFVKLMQDPKLRSEALDIEALGEGARMAMESPDANAKAKQSEIWNELQMTTAVLFQERFQGQHEDIRQKIAIFSQEIKDKKMPSVISASVRVELQRKCNDVFFEEPPVPPPDSPIWEKLNALLQKGKYFSAAGDWADHKNWEKELGRSGDLQEEYDLLYPRKGASWKDSEDDMDGFLKDMTPLTHVPAGILKDKDLPWKTPSEVSAIFRADQELEWQRNEIRMLIGRWMARKGAMPPPCKLQEDAWELPDKEFIQLELSVHPMKKGDKIGTEPTLCAETFTRRSDAPIFTQGEIERQVAEKLRPDIATCRGPSKRVAPGINSVNGQDVIAGDWHWRRVQYHTTLQECQLELRQLGYTAKDIRAAFKALPLHKSHSRRRKPCESVRLAALDVRHKKKLFAKDAFKLLGLNPNKNMVERRWCLAILSHMLKSNVTLVGTPEELMRHPLCELRDTDDRMWDRVDYDNRLTFSMLSKNMTPELYKKLSDLGLSHKDIVQIAMAYKCPSTEGEYEVKPRDGDEAARLLDIYKNEYDRKLESYPPCTFYEFEPSGNPRYAFHIDAVKGTRLNNMRQPILGSTNAALKRDLLQSGFTLKCAKDKTSSGKQVFSYYGMTSCNNCIGPASWRKYRNAKGNKYECPACLVNWKSNKDSTRWLKISNSHGISFIVELAEPEHSLMDKWKKERIEYYKRFEPTSSLRNQGISLPADGDLSSIVKLTGAASAAFWTALLLEDSFTSIRNVNAMFLHQEEDME
jgi:hypothetical protein